MVARFSSKVTATLDEYVTMVSARLAASSPHKIPATITAITRTFSEFHFQVSIARIHNLADLIDLFP